MAIGEVKRTPLRKGFKYWALKLPITRYAEGLEQGEIKATKLQDIAEKEQLTIIDEKWCKTLRQEHPDWFATKTPKVTEIEVKKPAPVASNSTVIDELKKDNAVLKDQIKMLMEAMTASLGAKAPEDKKGVSK